MDDLITLDRFLDGRIQLYQPKGGYRAGLDAVMLAAAAPVAPHDRVLELGSGTGAAALCLLARVDTALVTGIESDCGRLKLATRNLAHNNMDGRCHLLAARVPDLPIVDNHADHVITNPPYFEPGRGNSSANSDKMSANIESVTLKTWLDCGIRHLKSGGSLTVIHRTERLDDILLALRCRAGAVTIYPLWPKREAVGAKRVIVQAVKASRAPLRVARGIVLHGDEGGFTPQAAAVLRSGEALIL